MRNDNPQQIDVLMVGPILPTGGITTFINCCLEAKMTARFQVFNMARPPKNRIASRQNGYSELFNAGFRRTMIGALVTIKNIIIYPFVLIGSKAEIVHLAGTGWSSFWEFSIYGMVARIFGKKVIFHFHGPFEDFYRRSSTFSKGLIRWLFNQYDAIFVLSEVDRKVVNGFLVNQKVYNIPNGVKINADLQLTRSYGNHTLKILFLGGVDPLRKGLRDLIEAANLAAEEDLEVEWVIGGTDTALNAINQYGVEKARQAINYIGRISESEKKQWFMDCDIYILPSYDEGMPYSILEAMSYGLAIISTDVGGIPEMISEGINGYLLKPGDARGICECVKKLGNAPELLSKLSQNNLDIIKERFSETKIVNQIDQIYKEIAN